VPKAAAVSAAAAANLQKESRMAPPPAAVVLRTDEERRAVGDANGHRGAWPKRQLLELQADGPQRPLGARLRAARRLLPRQTAHKEYFVVCTHTPEHAHTVTRTYRHTHAHIHAHTKQVRARAHMPLTPSRLAPSFRSRSRFREEAHRAPRALIACRCENGNVPTAAGTSTRQARLGPGKPYSATRSHTAPPSPPPPLPPAVSSRATYLPHAGAGTSRLGTRARTHTHRHTTHPHPP